MLSEKVLNVLDTYSINVSKRDLYNERYYRELDFYSDLGENVLISVWYDGTEEGFVKSFRECADDFDVDEHTIMRVANVDISLRTLLDDAEAIKAFLLEVAEALQDYELSYNEYKCTITVTDGTEERTQDFYVEAKSFEKAVKLIEKQLQIEF